MALLLDPNEQLSGRKASLAALLAAAHMCLRVCVCCPPLCRSRGVQAAGPAGAQLLVRIGASHLA